MTNKRKLTAILFVIALLCSMFSFGAYGIEAEDAVPVATMDGDAVVLTLAAAEEATASTIVEVDVDGEIVEYDLADADSAQEYVGNYADNLTNDSDFRTNIQTAIAKVRESISKYATAWALIPPVIAIVLALITKEVYSSLFVGIVAGGLLYANFNFETTLTHVVNDGFVASLSDSYNVGILLFLVLLGTLVAIMNKAGGSAAFGRWASKHIKTRVGAQLATILLGVLIFCRRLL